MLDGSAEQPKLYLRWGAAFARLSWTAQPRPRHSPAPRARRSRSSARTSLTASSRGAASPTTRSSTSCSSWPVLIDPPLSESRSAARGLRTYRAILDPIGVPGMRRPEADRVGEAWGDWIASMGEWHVFGALTYDQRRRPGMPGSDVARAHVRRWLRDRSRGPGARVEAAVVALEYQRNGWPHFHPLLRLRGGLAPGDIAELGQGWFKPHGYAKLEAPRSRDAVATYAAKYLTKDLSRGDVIFWPPTGSLGVHQPGLAS